MKKLIYLHQYFAFPDSSAGTRSYDFGTLFYKEGYEVEIITGSGYLNKKYVTKKGWNKIEKDGIIVHALNLNVSNKMGFFRRLLGFLIFMIKSTVKILSIKADIVIATSTPLTISIPALIKKLFQGTPFIFEVRDVWPDVPIAMGIIKNPMIKKITFYLEKVTYNHSSHIITLSTDMEDNLLSKGMDSQKISVITNIAHISRFRINQLTNVYLEKFKNKKIVLYTGTIGIVNNLSYLVHLAKSVIKYSSEIIFVVVGDGIDKEEITLLAKNEEVLDRNFFILPPVSKNELPFLLNKATILSSWVGNIPELWANSANKFFDALAAGKPIVINHYGWQSRVIENCKVGYVLSPVSNEEEIRNFVDFILDENLIESCGNNALELASKKYSLDVLGQKYIEVIREHAKEKEEWNL
tara:strand:+ start:2082 stop:3314 length:1233 start_codon:yes stop_codon:yes gene_type:complete